jgi:hypothetical protein
MNSKPFIFLLIFLCFAVSFVSPYTSEASRDPLIVKGIAFKRDKTGTERVSILCNQSCTPELFPLEKGYPRVVMDIKEVLLIQTRTRNINTGGKLVKRVRSYLDKKTRILRVVLDLEPSKNYFVHPIQGSSGKMYMVKIKEDTDSPQSKEKQITILRPDFKPSKKEDKPQEAMPSPEKLPAVKAAEEMQPVEQGKLYSAREFAEAVDKFTKILDADPKDRMIYRLRGNAYDNLGDRQRAVADWTHAARLGDTILQSYLDFLQVKWQENPTP